MTENEKLRALLAEARDALRPLSLSADGFAQMRLRIDAALAEPVEDYEALYHTNVRCECGDADACRLARERDEARAEVERLTADLEQVDSDLQLAVRRLNAEVMRLQGAYKRGAEAMREAAALVIDDTSKLWLRGDLAKALRALPIPEDKP